MRPSTLAIACLAFSVSTAAELAPSTPGTLQVTRPDGGVVEMPLKHTRVSIDVSAFVARATIEQVFVNPLAEPVEAVYTFPLGDRAAVDDFELIVGSRTIRGEIKRREEARAEYEQARSAGYQAALLEQERPNIFTQSVANLEPGKDITVRIRTVETLRYERGIYRLAFPLVVGPRYVPGGVVSDARRINPPVLAPGMRSGHDVDITVTLDAGVPIRDLKSPSHRIVAQALSATRSRVELADGDAIPNKDFLLRWSVSSEKPALGLLAHRDGLDGFFTLLVQPKGEVSALEAMPKEVVFVLDTSGSMRGIPIDASKRLVAKALREMGPRDTFNLIRFAGDNEAYATAFQANASGSIEPALAWLGAQQGRGGTEMLAALRAAFTAPPHPNRVRVVIFLTDGYVGNEAQILAEIGKVLGQARIYTIGIGSSVNHYLLDRMAELGNGAYVFVRSDERADDALEAFRSWVTKPYLTDLTIDWGSLPVADVGSERLRDLGSGQTLTLVGRYVAGGEGDVVVRGRLGGRHWEQRLRVVLPERETRHEALAPLWARGRIEELMLASPASPDSVRAEVIALALEYRLMSAFTSFVAVDDSQVVNPAGTSPTIHQAVPLPEGVSFEGIFGKEGPAGLKEPAEALRVDAPLLDTVEQVTVVTAGAGATYGRAPGAYAEIKSKPAAVAKFSSEFVKDLPATGRFHQNAAPPAPGVASPDGARDRDFRTTVSGISGVDPLAGRFLSLVGADTIGLDAPAANPSVLDAAFRVLADLADDGKLSPSEGRPALAGLLAAQRSDGSVASDVSVHAIATWALAEAARTLPEEPLVVSAQTMAVDHLAARAGSTLEGEAARWTRLVLGSLRPGAVQAIPVPAGEPSRTYERVRAALAAARSGAPAGVAPGRSAFDRLIATIGRGKLKVVSL